MIVTPAGHHTCFPTSTALDLIEPHWQWQQTRGCRLPDFHQGVALLLFPSSSSQILSICTSFPWRPVRVTPRNPADQPPPPSAPESRLRGSVEGEGGARTLLTCPHCCILFSFRIVGRCVRTAVEGVSSLRVEYPHLLCPRFLLLDLDLENLVRFSDEDMYAPASESANAIKR